MKHIEMVSKARVPAPASDVRFCFWGVLPGAKEAFGKQVANEISPGPFVISGVELQLDYYCKSLDAY